MKINILKTKITILQSLQLMQVEFYWEKKIRYKEHIMNHMKLK